MRAIVRNIKNNQFYEYKGGNIFCNLISGIEKEVSDELAKNIFKISEEMSFLLTEFPLTEDLIKSLKLKFDYEMVGLSG